MATVYDYHGNARPPYSGAAVRPIVQRSCWACGGSGWRDDGLHEGTNVSFGGLCVHCAGKGFISTEGEAA